MPVSSFICIGVEQLSHAYVQLGLGVGGSVVSWIIQCFV